MNKLRRVSSKGRVVIPAKLRKKLKITGTVLIREDGGKIVMEPWVSMEEAFGSGGKEMIDAAIEISRHRRREESSDIADDGTGEALGRQIGVRLGILFWNLAQSCIKDAELCDGTRRNDRGLT